MKELCIITVIGKDKVGIVYEISKFCKENNINIEDIMQKIMADNFVMAMMIDIANSPLKMKEIREGLEKIGEKLNLKITIHHTDIFKKMHRI